MTPLRLAALALAAALPACATPPGGDASTGSSTGEPTTEASGSSSDDGNESTSTGAGDSTSATTSGSSEASSSSADSSSGDASTTTSGSTGPVDATSSSGSSSTGEPPFCGNLEVEAGEECDDGNNEPTDGCDECVVSRWTHVGVAQEVPIADLGKWKSCFSTTYEAGATVESILANCDGDHILLGCLPVGSNTLTMAAHAPRADVFAEVNYDAGERSLANGVAWYWSPYYGDIGFGPDLGEDFWNPCEKPGEDQQMCWGVGGNMPLALVAGRRCGEQYGFSVAESKAWLRVAYESWD